ncbi:sensor histidine kinase [Actinomadura macrotermitis]|uniref:histidine kinase n=1 Tax=Actinomadura macrotermitis TaxID=2585200 RepID=A0A7K0BPB9_9ACTN|nr:HAMP domain-containing sensor histidine kinase [Actinomadura macrotermitis]MQY03038.1 Adaptive-response sensory-kinase SasA [Actinomadura macrotermitis]
MESGFARRLRTKRTVRLRLTLLQGALFLVSGAGTIGITYLLASARFPERLTQGPADASGRGITGFGPLPPQNPGQAQQRTDDLHTFLTESGLALAIMVVLSLGLGWLVAGRILRPLRTMTASTHRIFEDNLHERLPVAGPRDELSELGDTINGLLARLEAAFEAQRLFVANASHELRTPITVERAILEVALADPGATVGSLRQACAEVLDSSRQQERLIDALLTLARSQRGLGQLEQFDLAAVARGVVAAAERRRGPGTPRLRAHLDPAAVAGDPRLVERMVVNLVDNALRYNVPGGTVDVSVETADGRAFLSVLNTGPVTPAEQIDRLLQPFQRLKAGRGDASQEGFGLGLSIVAAVAKAHGADLRASPGQYGGLEIEVGFPAVKPPRATAPARDRGAAQGAR